MKSNSKEINIRQYIEDMMIHIPEDKRATYELILLRCGFCEADDPLFPIVLFLLFMQSSVTDSLKSFEERIEHIPQGEGQLSSSKMTSKKSLLIGIVCLILFAFCLVGAFISGVSIKTSTVTKRLNRQDFVSRTLNGEQKSHKRAKIEDEKIITSDHAILIVCSVCGIIIILLFLFIIILLYQLKKIEKKLSCSVMNNAVGETINNYLLNEQILKIKDAELEKLKYQGQGIEQSKENSTIPHAAEETHSSSSSSASEATDIEVEEAIKKPSKLKRRQNHRDRTLVEQVDHMMADDLFDMQLIDAEPEQPVSEQNEESGNDSDVPPGDEEEMSVDEAADFILENEPVNK